MLKTTELNPNIYELWGKSSSENYAIWHPLIYHLLDTSAVALEMWENCLSDSFKQDMSTNFGNSVDEMGVLVSFWIGLHDIGKAGPEFQRKNLERMKDLSDLGLDFPNGQLNHKGFHATATTLILRRVFNEDSKPLSRRFRNGLATALGGHHGEFPSSGEIIDEIIGWYHIGDTAWQNIQNEIILVMQATLQPIIPKYCPDKPEILNPTLIQIVGLTTAADWISSNEEYFSFEQTIVSTEEYFRIAKSKAIDALKTLGWMGWKANQETEPFQELFPGYHPNDLQNAVISIAESLHSPYLAIIEAQTGSGKTEAALYMADLLIQKDQMSGLYVAMPTQATSNQMFSRVKAFLTNRYPENDINLHLVHGNALLTENTRPFMPSNIWADDDNGNIHSYSWFLPRKKTMLAPFGVGTVDQTFFSVLRSKHFFLRLFGLSHKVLIFDEVHAYDVYMTEIFKTLLHWLHAVGTSVIILTATLPEKTKRILVNAYTGRDDELKAEIFPRITIADDLKTQVIKAGEADDRQIQLLWINKDVDSIVQVLREHLGEGGCAAVICNTVKRAQQVFHRLGQVFSDGETVLILFHSRFPFKWRKEIEEKVLFLFGKDRAGRPLKAILVATQVIEQSLDLDFDLLITDLAPIDLMIQRIGRLHRHKENINRPKRVEEPECIISAYESAEDTLEQSSDRYVYEPYILAKTLSTLKGKSKLTLPQESDELIRLVYDDGENEKEVLEKAKCKMTLSANTSRQNAHNYLIPLIQKDFITSFENFFGDDPESLSKRLITAPTREIELSIQIVCIERKGDGIHTLDDEAIIDLDKPLSPQQVRKCLESAASINNRGFVAQMIEGKDLIPKGFKDHAALRWHFPIVFTENRCEINGYVITLDRYLGLGIEQVTKST